MILQQTRLSAVGAGHEDGGTLRLEGLSLVFFGYSFRSRVICTVLDDQ